MILETMMKSYRSKSKKKIPLNLVETNIGLPNIGNTCYMNAILQMLVSSRHFIEYAQALKEILERD
jgi:ubiquitin C-terminal hydrolase